MMTRTAIEIGGLRHALAQERARCRIWRAVALAAVVAATLITCRAALDTALAMPVLLAEAPQ